MAKAKQSAAAAAAAAAEKHVADICLFGNQATGAGWIAAMEDGSRFGDGEPRSTRSFTEAIWIAVGALEAAGGVKSGRVRVFMPGGLRAAWMPLDRPRTFGDLVWEDLPVCSVGIDASPDEVADAAATINAFTK